MGSWPFLSYLAICAYIYYITSKFGGTGSVVGTFCIQRLVMSNLPFSYQCHHQCLKKSLWLICNREGTSWPIMANHGSLRVVNSQGLFGFARVKSGLPVWAEIRAVAAMMKRYLSWSERDAKTGTADVGGECFWWIISLTWGVVY